MKGPPYPFLFMLTDPLIAGGGEGRTPGWGVFREACPATQISTGAHWADEEPSKESFRDVPAATQVEEPRTLDSRFQVPPGNPEGELREEQRGDGGRRRVGGTWG